MSGYKGYEIVQNTTRVSDAGQFTHVTYSILKGGAEVHRGMLPGPFAHEEVSAAIESAARQWIDLQPG